MGGTLLIAASLVAPCDPLRDIAAGKAVQSGASVSQVSCCHCYRTRTTPMLRCPFPGLWLTASSPTASQGAVLVSRWRPLTPGRVSLVLCAPGHRRLSSRILIRRCRWALQQRLRPVFANSCLTTLHRCQISVGRVLVLLIGIAPAEAFGPASPLLLHVMAGVQV